VLAYEIAGDLAKRAAENLNHLPNVRVTAESALTATLPHCDVMYVNAAVTDLPDSWLDALRPGGRLMAPLTPIDGFGGMLLATRRETPSIFDARFVSGAQFVGCVGGSDDDASAKLAVAFGSGAQNRVQSLRRGVPPDSTCWYAAERWWLSTASLS
jgi:protein-L-isoaspartate(D-aspartate) O-methyltransferase